MLAHLILAAIALAALYQLARMGLFIILWLALLPVRGVLWAIAAMAFPAAVLDALR